MTTKNKNEHSKAPEGEATIRVFQAVALLACAALIGFFVYSNATNPDARFPFKFGLDLAGGSHLVYEADVTDVDSSEVSSLMNVLRDVIERRINVFGVSEPVVYVERSSFVSDTRSERLVIELPGVTDVGEAVAEIGRTPLLEFKLIDQEALLLQQNQDNLANLEGVVDESALIDNLTFEGDELTLKDPYIDTGLTGRYLQSAQLEFAGGQTGSLANEPVVSISFNDEGGALFAEITRDNIGQNLAIFLDGEVLSAPTIREQIIGGRATISGGFTPQEARALAENLNFGALPVPIELASTQTIGASLGSEVLEKGVTAGLYGVSILALFMALWYRVPGVIAIAALSVYIVIMLALFMLIPVTLTAAGLAGFILSIGMAVDANVLVFERMKEEMRDASRSSREAARIGFSRAWVAIRDVNITSIFSAIVLFWFGTSIVKGFALVFGVGVLVSMFTAITVTRTLLLALPDVATDSRLARFFKSGLG